MGDRGALPKVRGGKWLADGRWALVLFGLRSQSVCQGRDDLGPQSDFTPRMVCRSLVHDQSEAWSQRTRPTAIIGVGELSNRLDHLAEVAHSHGAARAGSSSWFGRS